MIRAYISAVRPRQWTKNLILFAGIIFAHRFFEWEAVLRSIAGFVDFCLLSASIYLLNDIKDIDSDRLHPLKRDRPIASGKIGISAAMIYFGVMAAAGIGLAVTIGGNYLNAAGAYFLMMILYSYRLKHIVIVDMMVIAAGFVLRAAAGAAVVNVMISSWLLVCTTSLALFLVIAKRRHEVMLLGDNAKEHRKILAEYGDKFLDQMIAIVTALTLISYILYTVDQTTIDKFNTHLLILTAPFVLYGIFRYLYLVYQKNMGGKPEEVLLNDPPLIAAIGLWVVTAMAIIY